MPDIPLKQYESSRPYNNHALLASFAAAVCCIPRALGHEPSQEELNDYLGYFVTETMNATQPALIDASPNTLFVIAAGNDGSNNDQFPFYPAGYKVDNVVSVAATDDQDKLAYFSNYGKTTVSLAAPAGVRTSDT